MSNERIEPFLISQRNREFQETYSEDAYLDESALDREMEVIKLNMDRASETVNTIGFTTRDQLRTWNSLTGRLLEIEHGFDTSVEGTTTHDAYTRFASVCGLGLLHGDTWERILSFARKRGWGVGERLTEYAKWNRLAIESVTMVKIAGLSIRDVENLDLKQPGALGQGFRFMAESEAIRVEMSHERWAKSPQQSPIFAPFPNECKFALEGASGAVMAAVSYNTRDLKDVISRNRGVNKEVFTRFVKFWSKIQALKGRIYSTLENPDSPDFGEASNQLLHYQDSSSYHFRVIVLHLIGLSSVDNIYNLYRTASKFVRDGKEVEFYSKLMSSIKEYAQAESPEEGVLTSDEVPSIFDNDTEIDLDLVEAKTTEYADLVKDSFKKSAVYEYDIEPEAIEVPNLVSPQRIHVSFNKSKPQEFKVQLGYENEVGEKINIELGLGTNKDGHFDWSFIEPSSESDELLNLHKTFLLLVHGILVEVNRRATQQYEQKHVPKPPVSPASKNKEKGEYIPDAWRKSDQVESKPTVLTPIQEILMQETSRVDTPVVYSKIKVADDVSIDSLMRNLSSVDRDLVKSDINEYNTRGVGRFYRLRSRGPNGEPLYALRVRVSTRGDARVLLRQVESEQGKHTYEVIDIDYRKDIYRRYNLV